MRMCRSFCNAPIQTVQDDELIKDEHLEKVNPQQMSTDVFCLLITVYNPPGFCRSQYFLHFVRGCIFGFDCKCIGVTKCSVAYSNFLTWHGIKGSNFNCQCYYLGDLFCKLWQVRYESFEFCLIFWSMEMLLSTNSTTMALLYTKIQKITIMATVGLFCLENLQNLYTRGQLENMCTTRRLNMS